jgi:hypothetical protein
MFIGDKSMRRFGSTDEAESVATPLAGAELVVAGAAVVVVVLGTTNLEAV